MPVEHPDQPGLWLLRGALSTDECAAVSEAVAELSLGHSVQGRDPGVGVIPPSMPTPPEQRPTRRQRGRGSNTGRRGTCFAAARRRRRPGLRRELAALHSRNCTDARTWPALSAIAGAGGDALRALSGSRIASFAGRPPLFVQLQALERGAVITAHVDDPASAAAIATGDRRRE